MFSGSSTLQAAEDLETIKQRFVGDWDLVSYVQFPVDGAEVDMNYSGRLIYDAFDNMTGIGMPRDLPAQAAEANTQLRQGFAYWGSVSWDTTTSRVIHHVEGSPMVPAWVGGDNIRHYEFDAEGHLKLSLKNADGRITATLTWRKLQ